MGRYLIDNNVIANYFAGTFSEKAVDFLSTIINETPYLSVVTKIEALSWRSVNQMKEVAVKSFVNYSNIIPLADTIVEKCIEIRRACRIKTPDAIIAATAIVYDFTLLTSDSDFDRIPNLKILDPFDLQTIKRGQ